MRPVCADYYSKGASFDAKLAKNPHANAVVALVGFESELFVGFDRIEPLILQLYARMLFASPMPRPSWFRYSSTPRPSAAIRRIARVELAVAIASKRMQHVAREALRVHADDMSPPSPTSPKTIATCVCLSSWF